MTPRASATPLLLVLAFCCLCSTAWTVSHAARVFTSPMGSAMEAAERVGQWVRGERADPAELVTLTIGVHLRAVDKLESELLAISDPQNARYGQHLSHEAVQSMVAPDASSVQAVMSWLLQDGGVAKSAIQASATMDWISATLTFEQAERLLNARYHQFTHAQSGVVLHRCASYELPDHVAPHIDVIGPTTRFPMSSSLRVHRAGAEQKQQQKQQRQMQQRIKEAKDMLANARARAATSSLAVDAQPNDACQADQGFIVTPACLSVLYGINNFTAANPSTSVAVTGYLEQYIALSDLKQFFQAYQPSSVGRIPNIVGPNDQTQPGDEASLDIQYSMSVAQGANATFWYTAGRQPKNPDNEPFLVFMQSLDADSNPPLVISTSYGDYENTVDFDYSVRVNAEFVKAGARGISILFSSGDSGVGGDDGSCTSFVPNYPATSPWVTAVGSTQSYPETAAYFSSGGFSNYFPLQSWQTAAVKAYLAQTNASLPSPSYYNASGRAFPDVSTQGVNFLIVDGGFTEPVDGTSCSSPTFAGIVALLNDQRTTAGKSSLGFLNQLFYQNPSVFYDVTSGNNPGCNTNGFEATAGWDPVTGLGTPNFPKLSALVTSLP